MADKTRIGFITDTHYGIRNDNQNFHEYMRRSNDFYFKVFEERGIDTIVHGGDIVDRRKYINILTAKKLKEDFLDRIKQGGYDFHLICGNHDTYFKDTNDVNALDVVMGQDSGFKYYIKPETVELLGIPVLFLPWIVPGTEMETLNAIKETDAEVAFGHLEVQGFEFIRGVTNEHGWKSKEFKRMKHVFSGHFHHPSSRENITYTGAAYEFNWGDYDGNRGITIVDLASGKYEFIRNPHSIFQIYEYDDVGNEKLIKNDLENGFFDKMKSNYVKVKVISKKNPVLFDNVIEAVKAAEPIDYKIIENMVEFDVNIDWDETSVEDTPTIIRKYVGSMEFENEEQGKALDKYMGEVYNEAISLENVE